MQSVKAGLDLSLGHQEEEAALRSYVNLHEVLLFGNFNVKEVEHAGLNHVTSMCHTDLQAPVREFQLQSSNCCHKAGAPQVQRTWIIRLRSAVCAGCKSVCQIVQIVKNTIQYSGVANSMSKQETTGQMKALIASIREILLLMSVREHETKIKQQKTRYLSSIFLQNMCKIFDKWKFRI